MVRCGRASPYPTASPQRAGAWAGALRFVPEALVHPFTQVFRFRTAGRGLGIVTF